MEDRLFTGIIKQGKKFSLPPKGTMHLQMTILSGKVPSAYEVQTDTAHHLVPLPNQTNQNFELRHILMVRALKPNARVHSRLFI